MDPGTAGFSAPYRRKSAAPCIPFTENPSNQSIDAVNRWRGSCPQVNERSVSRATVLTIVLSLVAGPNASVLCKAWCDPAAAAAAKCHHEHGGLSATLTGTDDCSRAVPSTAVVVKEAARGDPPSSDPQQAVMVSRHHRAISSSEAHLGDNPRWTWSLAPRPLVTALRI